MAERFPEEVVDGLEPFTDWSDVPESELIRLVKEGFTAAFDELVVRTSDLAVRVATSILKNREDASDEVQNAFWTAYSRIDLFTCDAKFSTWLIRIVINRCYMRLRVTRRNSLLPLDRQTKEGDRLPFEVADHCTPEAEVGRSQVNNNLKREVDSIPPLLRAPLEMRYYRDLAVKDIATELGVSVAATKSRLHRAHLYLRDRMSKHATARGAAGLITD